MPPVFAFNQFLFIAKKLFNEKEEISSEDYSMECIYRLILNRAYYAAYNHTKEWLEVYYNLKPTTVKNGKIVRKRNLSAHKNVYLDLGDLYKTNKRLSRSNKKKLKKMSADLKYMFEKRVDADYNLNKPITEKDVEDAIKSSENIINTLKFEQNELNLT